MTVKENKIGDVAAPFVVSGRIPLADESATIDLTWNLESYSSEETSIKWVPQCLSFEE